MIGGVSHALHGLSVASAGFERAAARMVDATSSENGASVDGMAGAAAAMLAAKYAFMASLQVARTSNEMVAQMVEMI